MPLLLGVVGVLLVIVPVQVTGSVSPAADFGSDQEISNMDVFSAVAGRILGAASACDQISADRVSSAADRALELTAANATDDADIEAAKAVMERGAGIGRHDVETGKADCALVNASLTKLEQFESQPDDDDSVNNDVPDESEGVSI